MSEYLVQRQSLENIADEIRVLSGTTEPLGLSEMATNVNTANTEVAAQATQIEEIMELLEGKSVPGGGASVETCTVTVTFTSAYWFAFSYTAFEAGDITYVVRGGTSSGSNETIVMENVVCGTPIVVQTNLSLMGATLPSGIEGPYRTYGVYYFVATASGANATINIYNDD